MQETSNGQSPEMLVQMLAALGYENPKNKIQAHGLTVREIEDLRLKTINGIEMPQIPANKRPHLKVYAHEAGMTHVLLEKQEYDKARKISKPVLKKFYPNDFLRMSGPKENAFSHYDVIEVIHDGALKAIVEATEDPVDEFNQDEFLENADRSYLENAYLALTGNVANESDTDAQLIFFIKEANQNGEHNLQNIDTGSNDGA